MQITGSGTGYTFGTVNLGLLGAGSSAYINLDEFASKAKPAPGALPDGELEENITLTLNAYTDAGYSALKWTYERTVIVYWINSNDASFTTDYDDDFDDGTTMGWSAVDESHNQGGYPIIAARTDYVLSASYSCRCDENPDTCPNHVRSRMEKAITTPNRAKVFAIINVRLHKMSGGGRVCGAKYLQIRYDGNILVQLGFYDSVAGGDNLPINKWMRIVVALPSNSSITMEIAYDVYPSTCGGNGDTSYFWQDDFKVVSKN